MRGGERREAPNALVLTQANPGDTREAGAYALVTKNLASDQDLIENS
jgi:hypothetical protein